jgi:hypothetical protein
VITGKHGDDYNRKEKTELSAKNYEPRATN